MAEWDFDSHCTVSAFEDCHLNQTETLHRFRPTLQMYQG